VASRSITLPEDERVCEAGLALEPGTYKPLATVIANACAQSSPLDTSSGAGPRWTVPVKGRAFFSAVV